MISIEEDEEEKQTITTAAAQNKLQKLAKQKAHRATCVLV